ncbi:hypothetical protein BV898_05570 [Hypsibius exemplaris]|uniref:COMM domain-containing protein 5 n=1 Tax=Hypsibius exemplaris TaxID=2072580 RepID=A0A1W0WZ91_HYPEX|nr:hypothetical protein BV898_05570 [Hypsibius exemplaris]
MATTSTIRTSEAPGLHAAATSKDHQLDLSTKSSKALTTIRKLLDKVKNAGDAERLIEDTGELMTAKPEDAIATQQSERTSRIASVNGLSDKELELLVASLHAFLTAVTRTRISGLTADAFVKELERLKFPAQNGKILAGCLFKNLSLLDRALPVCPVNKLLKIRWRLDVIITSQAGKRILEPLILLELQTTAGTDMFEISLTQFHKMRYSTAAVLKEMQSLSKKKILSS